MPGVPKIGEVAAKGACLTGKDWVTGNDAEETPAVEKPTPGNQDDTKPGGDEKNTQKPNPDNQDISEADKTKKQSLQKKEEETQNKSSDISEQPGDVEGEPGMPKTEQQEANKVPEENEIKPIEPPESGEHAPETDSENPNISEKTAPGEPASETAGANDVADTNDHRDESAVNTDTVPGQQKGGGTEDRRYKTVTAVMGMGTIILAALLGPVNV